MPRFYYSGTQVRDQVYMYFLWGSGQESGIREFFWLCRRQKSSSGSNLRKNLLPRREMRMKTGIERFSQHDDGSGYAFPAAILTAGSFSPAVACPACMKFLMVVPFPISDPEAGYTHLPLGRIDTRKPEMLHCPFSYVCEQMT